MISWGILGTGQMAAALVPAIRRAGGEVLAVAVAPPPAPRHLPSGTRRA